MHVAQDELHLSYVVMKSCSKGIPGYLTWSSKIEVFLKLLVLLPK